MPSLRPRATLPFLALSALLALGALGLSRTALAKGEPRPSGGGRVEAIVRALALDEAQTAKLQELAATLKSQVEPLREERRDLRQQLEAEMAAAAPNTERVGRLTLALRDGREKARAALGDFDRSFSALLTPDQLSRYQELKQSHPLLRGREERPGRRDRRNS